VEGHVRWILLVVAIVSSEALADSWAPPSKQTYVSADKKVRFIVDPRPLESALSYYEDKVANREPAGAPVGSKLRTATATLQLRDAAGRWVTSWRKPLVNEIAPVDALVTNGGEVVTFDNWASMGYGDDVIVVYDRTGTVVRKLALSELFPEWLVAAQRHSVSSIWWRGGPRVSNDGSAVLIPIKLPTNDENSVGMSGPTLDLKIRVSDGEAVGLAEEVWKSALVKAAATAREKCRDNRTYITKWNSTIAAPAAWDEPAWHEYLREIYYRTAPMVDGDFPAALGTTVLRPPSASNFQPSLGWLKEALSENTNIPGFDVRAIGSPDYERLTEEIEKIAAPIGPNQLDGVELIVVVDASRSERVRRALARSGAKLSIVDPLQKLPQRPERIQKSDSAELPVCQLSQAVH
jgi:hypothetical protein